MTEKMKQSKNEFEKDLVKLMNSSAYGQTTEDVRRHTDMKLTSGLRSLEKQLNSPLFKRVHKINSDLVCAAMARGEVVLNEPIYLGMPVLEYSQQHMYHFFYKAMKPFYGDRVSLIYTDSDTLVLNVETDDRFNEYPNYAQRMD